MEQLCRNYKDEHPGLLYVKFSSDFALQFDLALIKCGT